MVTGFVAERISTLVSSSRKEPLHPNTLIVFSVVVLRFHGKKYKTWSKKVSEIETSLRSVPGGPAWRTSWLDSRALQIFRAGLKVLNEQGALPSLGSQPLTPFESACISYVSFPKN